MQAGLRAPTAGISLADSFLRERELGGTQERRHHARVGAAVRRERIGARHRRAAVAVEVAARLVESLAGVPIERAAGEAVLLGAGADNLDPASAARLRADPERHRQ